MQQSHSGDLLHIDNINLNNLRVFECVYRTRCMTTASKHLHLTQSGVSQHIKALEESLEVRLFDRINKKIMPTQEGDQLYKDARAALYQIEGVISQITNKEKVLSGTVNIGMPIEFGNNLIIPELARMGIAYPSLMFNLKLDFASKINDQILDGSLDFAFVDEFTMDRRITTEKVAGEVFELCATKEYLKAYGATASSKAYFENLSYVAYQEGEPVLRRWFAHHLKRKNLNLDVRAHVMDVQGIAKLIINGLGVGVLPDHLVDQLAQQGVKLYVFKGSGRPLINKISLAYLKNRSRKYNVDFVLTEIKEKYLK